MNDQDAMSEMGSGPTTPHGAGMPSQPPPQHESSKTGWWLLLGGLGCLGLLVVGIVAVFAGFVFYRSSAVLVPMPPSPMVYSSGRVSPQSYPWGERCSGWSHSGMVASDSAFADALIEHVFTTYARRVTDHIGAIHHYMADSARSSTSSSGKVTVTLSNAAGQEFVLELSYVQDPVGGWIFSLDNDPWPRTPPAEVAPR